MKYRNTFHLPIFSSIWFIYYLEIKY